MSMKLKKWFTASPGNQTREKRRSVIPGWNTVALIFIGLGLLGGCAGSSQQALTAQALTQIQVSNPNKELAQQVMPQATKDSLISYKDYQVGPEDVLAIEIFGQEKLNRVVRVNGQGEITLPLVGVVKVAGSTPQEIEKRLTKLYDNQFLVNPQVSVGVKEIVYQRVSVTGAVLKPGSYEIIGPRTLMEVLSLAGGIASQTGSIPAGDIVNVIHHQKAPDQTKMGKARPSQPSTPPAETVVIDLRRLVSGQSPELNIKVYSGDVVHVPFANTAYVLGGVRKPGNVAVKENLTVSQAVAMAGGIDPLLGTSTITILRFDEQGSPISINTNLNRIIARNDPDVPIKGSDVIMVNESTLKKALYLFKSLMPQPTLPTY